MRKTLFLLDANNKYSTAQNDQHLWHFLSAITRVKSGKFGQSTKYGQGPFSFHILVIGNKINQPNKR